MATRADSFRAILQGLYLGIQKPTVLRVPPSIIEGVKTYYFKGFGVTGRLSGFWGLGVLGYVYFGTLEDLLRVLQ